MYAFPTVHIIPSYYYRGSVCTLSLPRPTPFPHVLSQGMVNKGVKATKTLSSSVPSTLWTLDFADHLVRMVPRHAPSAGHTSAPFLPYTCVLLGSCVRGCVCVCVCVCVRP